MTSLLFGQFRDAVRVDEEDVRSTTNVIDHDVESAVADSAPDWGETATDPRTEGGLTGHQLASHVIPSERYVSPALAEANQEHNEIVNRQVSTSGTAAAREAAGQWGHGTMMVTEGIEPTIRDAAFGELYFAAERDPIQTGAGAYMTPARTADPDTIASAKATGAANARQAASPYKALIEGLG